MNLKPSWKTQLKDPLGLRMDLLGDWEAFKLHLPLLEVKAGPSGTKPAPSPIYISTKTVIAFLDRPLDLRPLFWAVDVLPYNTPREGVVKKQMKFNCATPAEVGDIEALVAACPYAYSSIIAHVESSSKFKDVRKVTVGLSKRDLLCHRSKPKGAFYNCFVVIVRVLVDDAFREFHVKVFNTGKIEVPGIQEGHHLRHVVAVLMKELNKVQPVDYVSSSEEIVLINSNFNCNYFINREQLYTVLRETYGLSAVYDPCSYPGIQCKIYFTPDCEILMTPGKGRLPVSVMIFRTGSVLIVGKCDEPVLHAVYEYLNDMFTTEYASIVDINCALVAKKAPKPKSFRKQILVELG